MNKESLEKKLKEINQIIELKYSNEPQIGVLSGLSGISLFQFYYSKYLGTDTNVAVETLKNSINKINEGYSFSTYCTGIAGVGWVLDHLEQENFISLENDEILPLLDDYLYSAMVSELKKGVYDFLHGATGYALYFLNRYKNTKSEELKEKYKAFLLEFIDQLKELSEETGEDKLKWISIIDRETGEKCYNLSLSHGMSSIVGILTKLYEHEDFKMSTEVMLRGAINYILSFKNKNNNAFSLFPNWIPIKDDVNYQSRLAWCYGDLGIGIRFWYAAKELQDTSLKNISLAIMKHAAKRMSPDKSKIVDAGICHGSHGNAQMFYRMFKETKDTIFEEAAEFWIQDGINKAVWKDGYAGYKQWYGLDKTWETQISLLEGVAGIGLTIIDYLADFETNWDECLMIS